MDRLTASTPIVSTLIVAGDDVDGALGHGQPLDEERRVELLQQLDAGDLHQLTFDAVTFRAVYPNENFLRFRDSDLDDFAASYAGQPFLRNHDTRHVEARDGTIARSRRDAREFIQRIKLTTQRGIRSFLEGQIDRFSIGWYWSGITCTVCGQDWLNWRKCRHWPGRTYTVRDDEGDEEDVLCELIFEDPRGKETSGVNAPAVHDTRILTVPQLCAQKAQSSPSANRPQFYPTFSPAKGRKGVPIMPDQTPEDQAVTATAEQQPAPEPPAAADDQEVITAGDAWLAELRANTIDAMLAGTDLSEASKQAVRRQLAGREDVTPQQVHAAIDTQRDVEAALKEDDVIHGIEPSGSGVSVGMNSIEKVEEAITALIEARRPRNDVRPLSGIREAYILLSGDYELRGMFVDENVGLANVNTATMAGIVANALNKVVVNQFQQYPRDFLTICTEQDFTTLQDVRWITLGGVGELPTVSEGSPYTELDWDDQTETDSFTKKGGYLGITLETIDKDDTRKVQQAPRALAQAAWLTLYKAFAEIFTANSGVGPTMSDGNNLFDSGNHLNLGSSAFGATTWESTRAAMRKQTELNSGERLGGLVVPRYALVPPDLEYTAIKTLASAMVPGGNDNDVNPEAEGDSRTRRLDLARQRVIVVDLWTDTDDWAAAADPLMYPSIGLGYRFGRTPEIFSVADERSGLMFTNDVMPIKIRFFFAIGPTDWRGLYKHNV